MSECLMHGLVFDVENVRVDAGSGANSRLVFKQI